ncbi:helix-turn-helix domain-containing protein [Eubacterium aggregans]|uniref:helix-turn-helix domain-containing protein n=1 Tax=Eubacterium aggregans TaxID=81409 RepID=UPI003F2B6886
MSDLVQTIGNRLQRRRKALGYSQEVAAKKAGVHPTYIGQVERGEKNAPITSLSKICQALGFPMKQLFENLDPWDEEKSVANQCYSLVAEQPEDEWVALLQILKTTVNYKKN